MNWVIFDMIGVIFEAADDVNDLLVPYILRTDASATSKRINELYRKASLGKISSCDFWTKLGFETKYPKIERDYLDSCLRLDPDFMNIAGSLKESYSLAVLSNDVKEWSSYLRNKFDLNELFKVVIISGEVGFRKPDREIYVLLLDRIHGSPSSCVLIDDRSKNLSAASQLGMKTIKFLRECVADDSPDGFEITNFSQLPKILDRVFE